MGLLHVPHHFDRFGKPRRKFLCRARGNCETDRPANQKNRMQNSHNVNTTMHCHYFAIKRGRLHEKSGARTDFSWRLQTGYDQNLRAMNEQLRRREFLKAIVMGTAGVSHGWNLTAAEAPPAVQLRDQRTALDAFVKGTPFATYNYNTAHAGLYRPYFHPIFGPNEKPITQDGEFPGTLRGHYWHRALFVAHQKINGVSFWEERQADCGRIVHLGFDEVVSGANGRFVERLAWRDLQGRDLLKETRTVVFPANGGDGNSLRMHLRLVAEADRVTFEKTPYNLLACRVINAMCRIREKQKYTIDWQEFVDFSPLDKGGQITNSEGKVDDACRGASARWCDFSGPLGDGTWGGITLMDHPENPRHPTPWHNWNNMTITASFTYDEPFTLRKGEELRLAYLVYVHPGTADSAPIEESWKRFSQQTMKEP